ncbi:MAG TPA: hypothetical protein VG225_12520 [Terracidiphilus sp.]|jgi:energy-coupling factor transporter transmembrane protein EcfT|nr:hypothetical protein [Terracidiphilus sp.]
MIDGGEIAGLDELRLTFTMIEKIRKIQNPLTIIAIFALLAEVVCTAGLAAEDLRHIFVWFVIGFPTLLVLLFFLTLNFNAKVLFGPGDFRREGNFLEFQRVRSGKPAKQAVSARSAYEKLASAVNGEDPDRASMGVDTLRKILVDAGYTSSGQDGSTLLADFRRAMVDARADNDKLAKLGRAIAAAQLR